MKNLSLSLSPPPPPIFSLFIIPSFFLSLSIFPPLSFPLSILLFSFSLSLFQPFLSKIEVYYKCKINLLYTWRHKCLDTRSCTSIRERIRRKYKKEWEGIERIICEAVCIIFLIIHLSNTYNDSFKKFLLTNN